MTDKSLRHDQFANRMGRRKFLKNSALVLAGTGLSAGLLAACGDNTATPTVASTTSASTTAATTTSAATTASSTTAAGTTAAATTAAATTAAETTAAGTSAGATTTAGATATAASVGNTPAPTVPNAAQAKQYSGATITFNGDTVGGSTAIDQALAAQFTKDTGITVKVIPHPSSSDDYYASLQRIFQGQSGEIDVMMLDVIWPGSFAQYLTDLNPKLGNDAKAQYSTAVQNDTVNGKLVAMPYFGDFGMLYYRTDLLQKYGFSNPPQTWDELQTMAQKIIDGEKASNANFTGFVFQGKAYEGLTCDALEWLASSGGGTIIDASGKVTLNNENAVKALNRAHGWIGTISPPAVTSYQEDQALNSFQAGNAAFMRNWPYAYALANDPKQSKVAGMVDVAPLPHDSGQKSVGTLGGWQLGVNRFSKNQDAAIEFVRYMTSQQVQTYRGLVGGYVPLNMASAQDPQVIKAEPYLAKMADVTRVARPSTATGINYNDVSTAFFQGVSQILAGQDAKTVLQNVQNRIQNDLQ
jgi:trehalose/maltose transport system substrate-binding protein